MNKQYMISSHKGILLFIKTKLILKVYIDGILQTKCKGLYYGSNDNEESQGALMAV